MSTRVERLTKALAFLEANEWTQGGFTATLADGATAYCAEGAYRTANGFPVTGFSFEASPDLSFFREVTPIGEALWEFNDDETRTKDDVVALFEKAIQKAKEEADG
ncbi:DUF6197 family protein [Herbidospora cretacea]|uniref:DUF6197 family protein n=1 Tax=Herbidospora cretacea TaxID=28444 RepID=UPI0007748B8C|nr:hypothetical protein [Herbidospora cretacea]